MLPMSIIDEVQEAYNKGVLFTVHALNQMNSPDRMILRDEVHEVIKNGKMIEDYEDDPRGHSCLICGRTTTGRTIHVVCAPKEEYLAIITAYIPSSEKWEEDMKTRRR